MLKAEKLEEFSSVKIKDYRSSSRKGLARPRQKGSILIGLIITMVIMASLGAGMLYVTTTSTFQELFANNHARAYYLAESGGRYATALARQALATNNPTLLSLNTAFSGIAPTTGNFTMANGKFQIENWAEDTSGPGGSKQISFDSTGTVNSGFLQAKRKLHYKINPSNQSGGGTSAQPITPDLSTMVALAGTDPLPNNSPVPITVSGDTGIKLTPSGGNAKAAIVVTSGSPITLTGDYSVQVKTASPNANVWMMGILFNINPGSATSTGLPDGYGLTYFYNWKDKTLPDDFVYSTIPAADQNNAMIILWQSVTSSGAQTYNWIAYKKLDLSSLPGYLTLQSQGNTSDYELNTDAVALVAQVDRTSSSGSNIIRVYYGSPSAALLGNTSAIDDTRRGYNLSNIQWPKATAAWSPTTDYFTLVTWDGINTAALGTAAIFSGDVIKNEPNKAVITSTDLTTVKCPNCNSVALYTNAATKKQVDFFDYSIFVPGTGGGADGGGGVSVSP